MCRKNTEGSEKQNCMEIKKLKKGCAIAVVVYALIALIFRLCAREQLYYRVDSTDMPQENGVVGELTADTVFTQKFRAENNCWLIAIDLKIATFDCENDCDFNVNVLDENNNVLSGSLTAASDIKNNEVNTIVLNEPAELSESKLYTISITSPDGVPGNCVTLYKGNSISAGRFNVDINSAPDMQTFLNGQPQNYFLCWALITKTPLIWGRIYIFIVLGIGLIIVGYCLFMISCLKRGKMCLGLKAVIAFTKYHYLLKQLVSRDFKTKYKRSVLGVLWSFLNPLLMMTVQYVVFSTLFKSSIPNYALYLMIGTVCFNFFSECTNMCLTSITGNASLITKVYMPKYIYPVSRSLSSGINMLFALIPLAGVMLITQVRFTKAIFLLPIPLILLFAFSLGIGMILASVMVFFRDMQFLWGVLTSLWSFITPIFYPTSIWPEKYLWFFKSNPLYHILRMMRVILIDGASPEPKAYIIAAVMSFVTLAIGAAVFKKNQDKFVLNI